MKNLIISGLTAIIVFITFGVVGFVLVFMSGLPVDSTLSVFDAIIQLFLPKILSYTFIGLIIGIIILAISSAIYRNVLKDKLSRFPIYSSLASVLIIVSISSIGTIYFWYSDMSEIKQVIIKTAQLSNLPDEVNDVKLGKRGNFFSSSTFMRFTARPDEINKFIQRSPGLKKAQWEVIGKGFNKSSGENLGFSWFNPQSIQKGRFYKSGDSDITVVQIDDIKNIVYIVVY